MELPVNEHGVFLVPLTEAPKGAAVAWYWISGEVEVEEPDHSCGPDCECWRKECKSS